MSICLIVIVCIMKLYLKFKLYSYIILTNDKLRKIINNDLPNIVRIRKKYNYKWSMNIQRNRSDRSNINHSSDISHILLGAKDFHQLIFVVLDVPLHYVHAWTQQTFKCVNVQN